MATGKITFFLSFCMICLTLSSARAEPVYLRNGTWKVIPVHGDPIEITEIDAQGNSLFFYKSLNGHESFIDRSNLKNAKDLDFLLKSNGDVSALSMIKSKEKEVMEIISTKNDLPSEDELKFQDRPIKIDEIEAKIVESDDLSKYVKFTIKATVTNQSEKDPDIICILQAIDHDGFEVDSVALSGEIPQGTSRILTVKSSMRKIDWVKVKEWKPRS